MSGLFFANTLKEKSVKFWNHIEQRLITRDGKIYYMGGTLAIDDIYPNSGIALNLDGTGFLFHYNRKKIPHLKNSKVYLPKYILKMVRSIYLEMIGFNYYYLENLREYERNAYNIKV